jgi:putative hemolysin
LLREPERLIGAILLGNNLVNVAMSALATAMAISIWGQRGILYVTGVLTVIILIFAEITPKIYAKHFNERVSFLMAPAIKIIMIVLSPIVSVITYISSKILLLVGVDVSKIKRPLMTEEEVRTCIRMGWDEGAITADESQLLARVFTLNDKTVEEIMVPRNQISVLPLDISIENAMKIVMNTGYSRFPVTKGDTFEISGFIHAKDLFEIVTGKKTGTLSGILRAPSHVSAGTKIDVQLRTFQANKLHQAVVLDDRGIVIGLVTLEDIIEELVGSIKDEHD